MQTRRETNAFRPQRSNARAHLAGTVLLAQTALAGWLAGCGSSTGRPVDPITAPPAPRPVPVVTPIEAGPVAIALHAGAAAAAVAVPEPPYPAAVRSVRFTATAAVYKQPRGDADKLGVVRKDTRARAIQAAAGGPGCAAGRWIEIAPRGWACESALAPSADEPSEAAAPSLDDDVDIKHAAPGVYGIVRGRDVQAYASAAGARSGDGRMLAGSNSVRAAGVVTVAGQRYWRTSQGDLIDAASIVTIAPSRWKGIVIDPAATALPAWVRARRDPRKPATLRATPSPTGAPIGKLAARTVVTVLELSPDGAFARVTDTGWIARRDLRAAALAAPPPGTADDERWFDVDLDEQVLVAYEGARPVYATLISSGKYGHYTPPGISRVYAKHRSAHMINPRGEQYSVADVPWTMYYDHNYALHTSYWHDGFGAPRSHGCINLAPRDARVLYQWSSPDVPPGWISVYGDEDNPGSLVRVRSSRSPDPDFRGYARTLREQPALAAN